MRNRRQIFFSKDREFFNTAQPKAADNEILIYGPIADFKFWGDEVTPSDIMEKLNGMNGEEISVRINSPGGMVFEGITIYNALVKHSAKVKVSIDGIAASAASIIAMSGDVIEISDNSAMMIHDPWTIAIGNSDDLLHEAEILDKVALGMVNTYAARSGKSKSDIREIMKAETWYTAEEAKENGFADIIIESKSKPEAKADLRIFSNVPEWVMDRYQLSDPPAKADKNIEIEPPPVSLAHRKRRLEIIKLTA